MTARYETAQSTVAAADGTATVRFAGPGMSFDQLAVDIIQLSSSSALLGPATLYRGDPGVGRFLAIAQDGLTGYFSGGGGNDVIDSGEVWSIRWTGQTPGAVCTASLSGTVRRRGT